jgi:DNA-binding transcriptional ArsR family regulator/uncharacterized protein YndB with AHSA1/START domain
MKSDDDLTAVWGALSDPTRRSILDLLRERPRTTGELCAAFTLSRFAVMKHLGVLEGAGLVVVRRRGRERWNHLNAVPLQRIVERWLQPYESHWAASLLQLKRRVESAQGGSAMTEQTTLPALGSLQIEQEIAIDAPRDQVFAALTGDVGAWWGRPYIMSEAVQALVLEPRVGGRFYEDWGGGQGGLWATVTAIKQGERIELTGPIGMGGPVHGVLIFELESRGGATVLKLSHRAFGAVNQQTQAGYDAGWRDLLDVRLRAFVERGERLGLGHEPQSDA